MVTVMVRIECEREDELLSLVDATERCFVASLETINGILVRKRDMRMTLVRTHIWRKTRLWM